MGKIFSSHSSGRSYTAKRHDIHGQSGLRQLEEQRRKSTHHAQVLEHAPTPRFQGRHSIRHAEASDSSKKAVAIFFTLLLACNELFPLIGARPLKSAQGSQKAEKKPKTTQKEPSHTLHQVVDFGTRALGNLAFGPLGGILAAPGSAAAITIPSLQERAERAHEAWNEAQHTTTGEPLLYGKLDAAAEGFEKAAATYSKFHEEHSVLAEYALSAAMVTAKGLTCAAQAAPLGAALGATVGAPFGPVATVAGAAEGALYMAGRGFLVCAQAAIAQDALGRGAHALLGANVDHFMESAIDVLASYAEKIDPRLQETGRGRMFSAGVLLGTGSAADISLGTAGLLKSLHKGPLRMADVSDAFVRAGLLTTTEVAEVAVTSLEHGLPGALQEIAFHRAINFGSQAMTNPDQTIFSYDPIHDLGKPGNYFEQPGTKEAFHKRLTAESSESFSQFVNQSIEKEWESAHEQLQTKYSQQSPTLDRQNPPTIQLDHYPLAREVLGYAFQGAAAIATITKNPELARTLTTAGPAVLQIMDSLHQISKGASAASSAASGAVAGSSFGPWGALIGGALGLMAALMSDTSNPNEGVIQALQQVYQGVMRRFEQLSAEIAEFRSEMRRELHGLRDQIDILQYYAMLGFFRTSVQIQEVQALQAYYAENIAKDLETYFNTLDHKVDTLLLEKRLKACSDIDHYMSRKGKPLATMNEQAIEAICGVLEDGLRTQPEHPTTLPNSNFNGYTCQDFSPKFITKNAALPSKNLFGYWIHLLQKEFELTPPVRPETLINMELYLHEASHYLTLRKAIPAHLHYDDDDILLKEIAEGGHDFIQTIEWLQNNSPVVVEKLMSKYTNALTECHTLFLESLDKEVERSIENALAAIPPSQQIQYRTSLKFSLLIEPLGLFPLILDKTPLNAFALPEIGHTRFEGCRNPDPLDRIEECVPLQLDQCAGHKEIMNALDPIFPVAERLGLGRIHFTYNPSLTSHYGTGVPYEGILKFRDRYIDRILIRSFFVTNDGHTISIENCNNILSQEVLREPWVGVPGPMTQEKAQNIWKHGHPKIRNDRAHVGAPTSEGDAIDLLDPIREKITLMRQNSIASLYAPGTPLAVRWQKALDELDASRDAAKIFLSMLGVAEQDIQKALNILLDSQDICKDHQENIAGRFPNNVFLIPPRPSETGSARQFTNIVRHQCERMHSVEENPFAARIIHLLGQFGEFSKVHQIAVERQREAEQKEKVTEVEKESPASQELTTLRKEVSDLRSQNEKILSQMERMMALMERLSLGPTEQKGGSHMEEMKADLIKQRLLQETSEDDDE